MENIAAAAALSFVGVMAFDLGVPGLMLNSSRLPKRNLRGGGKGGVAAAAPPEALAEAAKLAKANCGVSYGGGGVIMASDELSSSSASSSWSTSSSS